MKYLESCLALTVPIAWPSTSDLPSLGFVSPPCQAPLHLYLEILPLPCLLPQFREPRHPATPPWPQLRVNRKLCEGSRGVRKVPGSLSGTPDPGLRTPISSGNLGSPSQGPVAQFSQEASARVTTLSPAVDSSPGPGVQQLPKGEPETDLSPELPAAHLIGAWMSGQRLGWEASQEEAFLRSGVQFSGTDGLALPRDGVYYLYCHVGYRGRAPPAGRGRARSLTLRSALYRAGGAYGRGSPELLLEGAETVTPAVDPVGYRSLWYTSVGFGGLVQIRSGERVYVNISHPDMVDSRRGKTFFGAVMVG
ncbi:lymphotoxin-beta isoform X1 [Peromyscus leucopus]|uniref:lymphotoxin-beta isoform X1 n=1 Tax=Peromyscus leucopus TaxID=10041 RepID=UPI001884F8A0|nr:lymphotoxin-beta isoform X1 [Peromyscus leucopus]